MPDFTNTRTLPDPDLYSRLKALGKLNLLFRFADDTPGLGQQAPLSSSNVVPFISRSQHLAWRERWRVGRFVKLNWTPEERAAILRQDALFGEADCEWQQRHPTPVGRAVVVLFPRGGRDYDFAMEAARTFFDSQKP